MGETHGMTRSHSNIIITIRDDKYTQLLLWRTWRGDATRGYGHITRHTNTPTQWTLAGDDERRGEQIRTEQNTRQSEEKTINFRPWKLYKLFSEPPYKYPFSSTFWRTSPIRILYIHTATTDSAHTSPSWPLAPLIHSFIINRIL